MPRSLAFFQEGGQAFLPLGGDANIGDALTAIFDQRAIGFAILIVQHQLFRRPHGAGAIGEQLCNQLLQAGVELVVIDSLGLESEPKVVLIEALPTKKNGKPELLWEKTAAFSLKSWEKLKLPTTKWAGQEVRFRVTFETIDELKNDGFGVLVDNMRVEVSCTTAGE